MSIESRLRHGGVKIWRLKDGRHEERLLKLEEKMDGKVCLCIGSNAVLRRRKYYDIKDIASVTRDSVHPPSSRPAAGGATPVKLQFKSGPILDLVCCNESDTVELFFFLQNVTLAPGPQAEMAASFASRLPPAPPLPQRPLSVVPKSTLRDLLSPEASEIVRKERLGLRQAPAFASSLQRVLRSGASSLQGLSPDVPELPLYYIPRPAAVQHVVTLLTDEEVKGKLRRACIVSEQSTGKSSLAVAAVLEIAEKHSTSIDAIVWVRVGKGGADRLHFLLQSAVHQLLKCSAEVGRACKEGSSGGPASPSASSLPNFSDPELALDALVTLSQLHGENRAVCVLDDVWETEVVEAFEEAGLRLLVTTREQSIAARCGGERASLSLGPLSKEDATELLGRAARLRFLPPEANDLITAIGNTPMAVEAVGSALRHVPDWAGNLPTQRHRSMSSRSYRSMQDFSQSSNGTPPLAAMASVAEGDAGGRQMMQRSGVSRSSQGTISAATTTASTDALDDDLDASQAPAPRFGANRETTKLISALEMAMNALPFEYREMYDMVGVLPSSAPLPSRLLAALWEVEETTSSVLAESMLGRGLLQHAGPATFTLGHDLKAAIATAAASDEEAPSRIAFAVGLAKEFLGSLDALHFYTTRKEVPLLLSLWSALGAGAAIANGAGGPHVGCPQYIAKVAMVAAEADAMRHGGAARTDALDSELDVVVALDMLFEFTRVTGCSCAIEPMEAEQHRLRHFLDSENTGTDPASLRLEAALQLAALRLTARLGQLYAAADRHEDAITSLNAYLDDKKNLRSARGGNGSPITAMEEGACHRALGRAVLLSGYGENPVEAAQAHFSTAAALQTGAIPASLVTIAFRARALQQVAELMEDVGGYPKPTIEAAHRKGLDAWEASLGVNHRCNTASMECVAKVLKEQGDDRAAQSAELMDRVFESLEAYYGPDSVRIAPALQAQAAACKLRGNLNEEHTLLMRCHRLYDKSGDGGQQVPDLGAGEVAHCLAVNILNKLKSEEPAPSSSAPFTVTRSTYLLREGIHEDAVLAEQLLTKARKAYTCGRRRRSRLSSRKGDRLDVVVGAGAAQEAKTLLRECVRELGRLRMKLGKVAEAEEPLMQYVAMLEAKDSGASSAELTEALTDLISVMKELNKPDIDDWLWKILDVHKKSKGRYSLEVSADLDLIVEFFFQQEREGEALKWVERSLDVRQNLYGANSKEVARSKFTHGKVLMSMMGFAEAEKKFKEAHTIDTALLGPTHPDTINDLKHVGMALCKQVKYADAEPFFLQVLEAERSAHGGDEFLPVVAMLNVVALVRYAMGRLDDAEPLMLQVLELRKKLQGPKHVAVAESLMNLATLLNSKGKYKQALQHLQKALSINQESPAADKQDVVTCMVWMADTEQKLQRFAEAEKLYRSVLEISKEVHGPGSPTYATILHDLAELLHRTNRYEEAEQLHVEALRIRTENQHGADVIAESNVNLSLLVTKRGKSREAEAYQNAAFEIREKGKEKDRRGSMSGPKRSAAASAANPANAVERSFAY